VILGASFDTPEENKAFKEAQGFPYPLLADTDKSVGAAYGAKKGDDEQWADFAKRVTHLIDPDGVVRRAYTVTDVATHPETVLNDILSLSGAAH
jgi:thioredoxin-dependent peroxiredoxin